MRVHGMSLGAAKACSGHSQESSSLRRQQLLWRQQLTWVIVASALQSTPTMLKKQQVNAHGLPREGQPPLLYRRQQQQVTQRQPQAATEITSMTTTPILGNRPTLFPIRSRSPTMSRTHRCRREGGHSVPHSGVTGPQRLSVSDLPPLYGPHLTPAPPCAQSPRASIDSIKLPPLPAAATSGSSGRGRARAVGAASDSVKLPPLPAAPAAAASVSSPRGAARAVGPMARSQPERVPLPPWGTRAAEKAQGTRSLRNRTGGLWHGSAARPGHDLPPMAPAHRVPLCTGTQPAWKPVWRCGSENQQPWDTSVKEMEKKLQEEELPETQASGEWDQDLQSALLALLKANKLEAEACAFSQDPWDEGPCKLSLTSEPQETSGFSASPLFGDPSEERATHQPVKNTALHKQQWVRPENLLHLTHQKREELEKVEEDQMYADVFGGIFSSADNEECPMTSSCDLGDPAIAGLEPAADPSVPVITCSLTKEASGESQNDSELVSPELLPELRSDSEDSPSLETLLNNLMEWEIEEASEEWDSEIESPLSIPPQDEEVEPAPTTLDNDLSDQGHSEPLPWALPQEAKGFAVCASPADAAEEAEAAGMEAGRAQAAPPQEKPCGDEPPAGACQLPAQPLAHSVPAGPAGSAAVPQPPAPRPWRSMAKRARRALRRLFSISCLRGQPEE